MTQAANVSVYNPLVPRTLDHFRTNLTFLVQAKDHTEHWAYYFLRVNPLRLAQFLRVSKQKANFNLKQYGDILVSGYGKEVPESDLQVMRTKYGWRG